MTGGPPAEPGRGARPHAGRDRPHRFPGRRRGVNVRFTDDEYTELATAADQAGLTPTGFCAQAALDAARGQPANTASRIDHQTLSSLQAELIHTRTVVNQLRVELAAQRAADQPAVDATAHRHETMTEAARALAELDNIISRIHHQLPPAGGRR